jgi:hypothetical protein
MSAKARATSSSRSRGVRRGQAAQHAGPDAGEPVGHGRVEPSAGASSGHLDGGVGATEPVEDHRLGRDHADPCRQGDVVAGQPVGVALPVPALHAVPQPQAHARAQRQPLGHEVTHLADGPGDAPAAVLAGGDHPGQVAGPVDAGAPADGGQQGQGLAEAGAVGPLRLHGHGQVVPEQVAGLVRRGGAADVLEQRRPEDVAHLGLGQVHRPGQAGGDQAAPHGLLRLLAHAEVGGHRQRRQQVGEPQVVVAHSTPSRWPSSPPAAPPAAGGMGRPTDAPASLGRPR